MAQSGKGACFGLGLGGMGWEDNRAIRKGTDSCIVIGIDCAVDPKKVGLAQGKIAFNKPSPAMQINEVCICSTWPEIVQRVAKWSKGNTLLALDSPLGWPQPLGKNLVCHKAGAKMKAAPNEMFRRRTDDVVAKKLSKRGFDVGADKIARTARQALSFLGCIRQQTEHEIPLGWNPGAVSGMVAIEVYPAATLIGRDLPASKYKKNDVEHSRRRTEITEGLAKCMQIKKIETEQMKSNHNILDAAVCVAAGFDFAMGEVIRPEAKDRDRAEQEGWIWVRSKP